MDMVIVVLRVVVPGFGIGPDVAGRALQFELERFKVAKAIPKHGREGPSRAARASSKGSATTVASRAPMSIDRWSFTPDSMLCEIARLDESLDRFFRDELIGRVPYDMLRTWGHAYAHGNMLSQPQYYVHLLPQDLRPADTDVDRDLDLDLDLDLETTLDELPAQEQERIDAALRARRLRLLRRDDVHTLRVGDLTPSLQAHVLSFLAEEAGGCGAVVTPRTQLGELVDDARGVVKDYVDAHDVTDTRDLLADVGDVYDDTVSDIGNMYIACLPAWSRESLPQDLNMGTFSPWTTRLLAFPAAVRRDLEETFLQAQSPQFRYEYHVRRLRAGIQIPAGVNRLALYRQKLGDAYAPLEQYVTDTARAYLEQHYYDCITFMIPSCPCRIEYKHTARRTVFRDGRYEDVEETRTGSSLIEYATLHDLIESKRAECSPITDPYSNQPVTRLTFAYEAYCDIVRVLDTYGTDALPTVDATERNGAIPCPPPPAAI